MKIETKLAIFQNQNSVKMNSPDKFRVKNKVSLLYALYNLRIVIFIR